MIGPIFGFVGFVRGHISARKRSGNRLDRLQYCEGYAISFLLSATLPGIAVGRFVGLR
ncbi:MAG: apolipoprotein acyltransferase [Proteobacteria bacterium]|nr:apolipoprotein acyltransferase [Pseudomonadota bacterium]